jgi:hypothetical protein
MNHTIIKKLFNSAIVAGICFSYLPNSYSQSESNSATVVTISTSQFRSDKIPDSIFEMTHLRDLTITGMDCDYSLSAPFPLVIGVLAILD